MQETSDLVARVRLAMDRSDLIRAVSLVCEDGGRSLALGDSKLLQLTTQQIRQLEGLGNTADDWTRVRVAEGFNPERVRQNRFHGDVVLGRFQAKSQVVQGLEVPSGVCRSLVADCVIGHDTLVADVKLLTNYVVGPRAVLWNCGRIVCEGTTSFANGRDLTLGIESGGREVRMFAELDVDTAAQVTRSRDRQELLRSYVEAVGAYVQRTTSTRGIIESGASVQDTAMVRNCYLGPGGQITEALVVEECTILSTAEEPAKIEAGACVRNSLLQWGSHVTTMAIVENSVLTEHSHVERHGKVTSSLVGPNTGVASGEVTSSLLGPFVGFHHQALLIAAVWPEGRGNVAYGANVGANHTSKAPDQEFWPGEGTYLGLGVNIKYPSDFRRAPYSVISSGVTTLPQRIAFPFSLVNTPGSSPPGISPAFNEIIPAWLLTDSVFSLKRNEWKFQARNKSRRSAFDFAVFRPAIVELMSDAASRLESVRDVRETYTDREIEGLGKNFMLEKHRRPAIEAYRFYIRYYALLGLLDRVRKYVLQGRAGWDQLLVVPEEAEPWEHQRRILCGEIGLTDVRSGLRMLAPMLEKVAGDVERSKAKDDERGVRIIDDYAVAHVPAARDPFVQYTWKETRRLGRELDELLKTSEGNWE